MPRSLVDAVVARTLVLVSAVFLLSSPSAAQVLVPDDYDTIQEAIDAASDGDTIEVAAGIYVENLDFSGKAIEIIGIDGAADTILDGSGLTAGVQVGCVVIFETDETSAAILDGFTLQSGTGREGVSNSSDASFGGAIYIDGASPTLRNLILDGNSADDGGAVFAIDSDVSIEKCTFDGNSASLRGGGFAALGLSSPVLTDCDFLGNSGPFGGAIHIGDTLSGSATPEAELSVTGCLFDDNFAGSGGGAISSIATTSLVDCEFVGNTADFFAGAMWSVGELTAEACVFQQNEATAGGVWVGSGAGSLRGCVLADNSANTGGIFATDGDSAGTIVVDRCTLVGNTGSLEGDGFVLGGGALMPNVDVELTNSIVWDQEEPFVIGSSASSISVTYCVVEGGYIGTGNIDEDPLFVDAASGDYRLEQDSPAINAGDPAEFDPDGSVVDMGAIPAETTIEFLRGDVDGNGVVSSLSDALSLLLWAFASGVAPACEDAADVDDSGSVVARSTLWRSSTGRSEAVPSPPLPGQIRAAATPPTILFSAR